MHSHNRQAINLVDLKNLLFARFKEQETHTARLQARFPEELASSIQTTKPEMKVLKDNLNYAVCEIIANRLKSGDRSGLLLKPEDVDNLVPALLDDFAKIMGEEFGAQERRLIDGFAKAVFKNLLEMANGMIPPGRNPYDQCWRWVNTVLDIAAERGILPIDVLSVAEATGEIERRMFTKSEFVIVTEMSLKKFLDVDVLKEAIFQPILEMLLGRDGDEDSRRELEQEFEAEAMPQLRKVVDTLLPIVNAWISEETQRIYGTV